MGRLRAWINDHQVTAFFILAYLITWPGFLLALYIFAGNEIVEVLTSRVVFGPALGAMIVSAVSSQEPKLEPEKKRWSTFLIAWILSSVVQARYLNLL